MQGIIVKSETVTNNNLSVKIALHLDNGHYLVERIVISQGELVTKDKFYAGNHDGDGITMYNEYVDAANLIVGELE